MKKIPSEKEITNIKVTNKKQEIEQIKKSLSSLLKAHETNNNFNKIKEYIEIWLETKEISCSILEAMNTLQNSLVTNRENINIDKIQIIHNKIKDLQNKDLTQYKNIIENKYYKEAEQDIKSTKELYEELTKKYTMNNSLRHILDQLAKCENVDETTTMEEINKLKQNLHSIQKRFQHFRSKHKKTTSLQKEIINKIECWIAIKENIYDIMINSSQNDSDISYIISEIDYLKNITNNLEKESIYYNEIKEDMEKAEKMINKK